MVFNILNVFFLDSVNRSLYNDCFWAILWCFNAFCFVFQFFSTRGVNRNFQCSFLEWRVRYLKGQKWLMLKAATGIIDHGVKTRISVEKRAKALVFKKNRRSSLLEKRAESQISKSTVAWICDACRQWACIANTTFTKRYRTKYLKDVSSHWESFPFICLRSDIVWHFLMSCAMSSSLFICITQRFSATVLTLNP